MRHPIAFLLDALRPGGGLHAAAGEGETKTMNWLLENHIYDVNGYCDDITALYNAVLSRQPDSILTLLRHKADPNLPCINGRFDNETPVQLAIYQANASSIKLLIMHGADDSGLKFRVDRGDIQALFYETLAIKKKYDALLKAADAQLQNKQYQTALINYQQAGDVWYKLSEEENLALYKRYYLEQALTLYKKAISCYKPLSVRAVTGDLKTACQQLFERAADCCYFLDLTADAKLYSSQAACLYPGLQREAYSLTSEGAAPNAYEAGLYRRKPRSRILSEEQQPLLDNSMSYKP